MRTTGIILAGGRSSRMGRNKALLEISGRKCIEHVIGKVKHATDEIFIVANTDEYDFLGVKVYHDILKGFGPLGGIHTGLTYSATEKNLVVACDMPFLSAKLLKYILAESDGYEIVIPSMKGELHSLCGVYTKHCSENFMYLLLNNENKLSRLTGLFHSEILDITPELKFYRENLFFNMNTIQELNTAKEMAYEN